MKSKTRNILFTFDYELFLGAKSGTVDKCLLEPTNLLINLFDKYAIEHGVFFVDTTYLIRLRSEQSEACKRDFELIKNQLQNLILKGHYVYPHIHPHWLDAVYDSLSNNWALNNYSKYRFHNINPEQRENLFEQSIKLLREIIDPIKPEYKIDSYRAGGWSIQPFEDFLPCFKKYGIKHDFSVVPGFKNLSVAQYFDFSNCPSKDVYNFTNNPVSEVSDGEFKEYTISTIKINKGLKLKSKVWGKYLWKTGQRSIGNGSGLVMKDEAVTGKKSDFLGSSNNEMLSIELLTAAKLGAYRKVLNCSEYLHFISHPKMLSNHNIKTFERFIHEAKKRFVLITDFYQIK